MKTLRTLSLLGIAFLMIPAAFAQMGEMHAMHQGELPLVTKAVAVVHPTHGNDAWGMVTFTLVDEGVQVEADFYGLEPGKHGFHIHQWGDCTAPDGTSAGGHFNPTGDMHGSPPSDERHMGDMGNVLADEDGRARKSYIDSMIKLNGPHSIIGRGVILHAGEDDFETQPTGAAGPRVACGVIGIAKDGVETK